MESGWYWRLVLVLGLVALSAYYALPSIIYFEMPPDQRRSREAIKETIPTWLPSHRLNLGIDLQGGLHLVMGVDTEKAVQNRADRLADEIVEGMEEKGKKLKEARRPGDEPVVQIELEKEDDWPVLKEILDLRDDAWEVRSRSGTSITYGMRSTYRTTLEDDAVAQALKTLRNRIDKYGVTEPEVRKRGKNSILIQIAGLTAEDEAMIKKDIIGKTAQLEFKIVDDTDQYFADVAKKPDKPEGIDLQYDVYLGYDDAQIQRPYLQSDSKEKLQELVKKYPPPANRTVGIEEGKQNPRDPLSKKIFSTWLLDRKTPLTGDSLVDAFVAFDSDENQYSVSMKFDRKGAVVFEKLTRENTKRKMAIVLDDVVDSAPIIQGPIPNGNARITLGGSKTQQEVLDDARALSIVLKAGALPAPVYPQENRTVGATMGDDAVTKGRLSILASLITVLIVMVGYYRGSGAIGVLAMAINILMQLAVLSAWDATLTLPGIAGFALTIGMAVDANIVQFERIREELRLGKTIRSAIDAGFDKAFSAIFDAHVTSVVAAIILYQYGSGPIRGFATTLGVGMVINLFTAVVIPRLIMDFMARRLRIQSVSI
jgi:preprotein translocase subunit SecD